MLIRYLLLFAFLMVSSVGAASEVQLYLETGRVKVKNQGKVRFLSHSDPLNPLIVELELGEQVLTGKNTRARIEMREKEEEIRLRVDTLFKVNSLDLDHTEVEVYGKQYAFIGPLFELEYLNKLGLYLSSPISSFLQKQCLALALKKERL